MTDAERRLLSLALELNDPADPRYVTRIPGLYAVMRAADDVRSERKLSARAITTEEIEALHYARLLTGIWETDAASVKAMAADLKQRSERLK